MAFDFDKPKKEFEERVVQVSRVSKVVKGGKKMGFRTVVVIGNHKGRVGVGVGKAAEVSESVRKAVDKARKNMIDIPIINDTIPHTLNFKWNAVRLFLGPAAPGTGVIAGGAVRSVLELAGIKNVLSKLTKSTNALSSVFATFEALRSMHTAEEISDLRGKTIIHPGKKAHEEAEKLQKAKEAESQKATETQNVHPKSSAKKPAAAKKTVKEVTKEASKENKEKTKETKKPVSEDKKPEAKAEPK